MNFFNQSFLLSAFALALFAMPAIGATCSSVNLIKCLDSVCATNSGANPAARCQLCGTASAGNPVKSAGGLSSLSLGYSSKTTISETEKKDAPSSPGELYVWATEKCIEKNAGCQSADVDKNYDKLIEQSCRAAINSSNFTAANKKSNATKTLEICSSEIYSCINKELYCDADFSRCDNTLDFNNFFNSCQALSPNCDQYLSQIKSDLQTVRSNRGQYLENIVTAYQDSRTKKQQNAILSCQTNKGYNDCITQVCQFSMRNNCLDSAGTERMMANQLCNFHLTACDQLDK